MLRIAFGPFFLSDLWASWAVSGASWDHLGAVLGRLAASWSRPGTTSGRFGASWGVLGASWRLLAASWGVFGPSCAPLGASWRVLGASGHVLGASWRVLARKTSPKINLTDMRTGSAVLFGSSLWQPLGVIFPSWIYLEASWIACSARFARCARLLAALASQ